VFTGNPTAPTPPAGDADTSVATTSFVAAATGTALNNGGRNLLHNPLFAVAQRGVGPFTASGYNLDRWSAFVLGSTMSVQQNALADVDRTQVGDEAARFALVCVGTGTAGAGDYVIPATQLIEDVSRLAGKTVILSFWARVISGSATSKLGISVYQNFGTGGSPSANVTLTPQPITLAATWTRYTTTWTVPSLAGKTLGTALNSHTGLQLWMSSGATNNAAAGGIGVQSYTLGLWGVQLEVGSVATPLEKPDPQQDLAKCQRFYEVTGALQLIGFCPTGSAAVLFGQVFSFTTPKRAAPTLAVTAAGTGSNATGLIADNSSVSGFRGYASATAPGAAFWNSFAVSASADL
jgi:hypothetical protein